MAFKSIIYVAWLTLVTSVVSERLHLATEGLLQIHPSFTGDGITLYPGHHPDHDTHDLAHLKPQLFNELYYSQEGHRPALHGAKHGSMRATFIHPTVVLDHSSHLKSVECSSAGKIKICFKSPEAFQVAEQSWNLKHFNLITFHVGCGDETSGKRTFFHASHPVLMDPQTLCTVVPVTQIEHEDAVDSGEISWGTYEHPEYRKRVPALGHVRLDNPGATEPSTNSSNSNDTTVDLTHDAAALHHFFLDLPFDEGEIDALAPADEDLETISEDGTISTNSSSNGTSGVASRRHVTRRSPSKMKLSQRDASRKDLSVRHIEKRFLLEGVVKGLIAFGKFVLSFVERTVETVVTVAKIITEIAIIAGKLIAVAFGVPFKHSYHGDFPVNFKPKFEVSNRPPNIFGIKDGVGIASSGALYTVQCAKCGIRGDFSVDGRLAFSIKDGVTEGSLSLENHKPFVIDAQFGINVDLQVDKSINLLKKQLGSVALSPFTIPGIVILGPEVSVAVELSLNLAGQAELLVGGSLSISAGTAALDVVNKKNNKLTGLKATFTPVAKLQGSMTATAQLGLPVALEFGVDILNGKFKKTAGVVEKPSVYMSATLSRNEGKKCNNGVEIRVGVKNQIYFSILDLYNYYIQTVILYERGLTCITNKGFDSNKVEDQVVFNQVIKSSGGKDAVGNSKPKLKNVASTLKKPTGLKAGYRIIMDRNQSSILVAGTDGYIYLVGVDKNYDATAPWGAVDAKSDLVNLDVFGRVMGTPRSSAFPYPASKVVLSPANKVPSNLVISSLSMIKQENAKNNGYYAISVGSKKNFNLYYPTFCPTPQGLRLFATKRVLDKDGKWRDNSKNLIGPSRAQFFDRSFALFGVKNSKDCRTIKLISNLKGT